jgi:hypothetical protein
VVGINPIWVIRQEDYNAMAHWEHPSELSRSARPDQQARNQ